MSKSPRTKFIEEASKDPKKLAAWAWDAMMLASSRDPEHEQRLAIIERQLQRLGAPQYRVISKGRLRSARKS